MSGTQKTPAKFLAERQTKALSTIPRLTPAQVHALMGDERAMELLDFRDRDELIVLGLARRMKPTAEHPYLRTWITITGLMVRAALEMTDDDEDTP